MLSRRSHVSSVALLANYCETLGQMRMHMARETALRSAKVEAELASRAKSEFLANMSHELRTPLNAIIGFSDLIRHLDGASPAKNVEYAGNIAEAGRHLLNIISDILDIAKIESGTASLSLAQFDIRELIEASVMFVRERIEEREQRLEMQLAPELPVLMIDGRRVKQVLINLLSNAHKFTPNGGRIVVMAQPTPDGGAAVAVTDTGPGMTKDELQVALKPFGQVRHDHLHTHGGTGLGLPIAVALAKQHGGDLQLVSEFGVGTTALLTLPPAATHFQDQPHPAPTASARTRASFDDEPRYIGAPA